MRKTAIKLYIADISRITYILWN